MRQTPPPMLARAVAAGARPGRRRRRADPGRGAGEVAQADNERAAKPYAEAALAVAGWQAAALRGRPRPPRQRAERSSPMVRPPRTRTRRRSPATSAVRRWCSPPAAAEGPTVADAAGWAAEPWGSPWARAWQARPAGSEDAAAANSGGPADEAVAHRAAACAAAGERARRSRARALLAARPWPRASPVAADAAKRRARRWGRTAMPRSAKLPRGGGVGRVVPGARRAGRDRRGVLDGPRKAVAEGLALASQGQLIRPLRSSTRRPRPAGCCSRPWPRHVDPGARSRTSRRPSERGRVPGPLAGGDGATGPRGGTRRAVHRRGAHLGRAGADGAGWCGGCRVAPEPPPRPRGWASRAGRGRPRTGPPRERGRDDQQGRRGQPALLPWRPRGPWP